MNGIKHSGLLSMLAALGIFTVFAGGLLGVAYELTLEPIAVTAQKERLNAVKSVVPDFDNDAASMAVEVIVDSESRPITVYPAYRTGVFVGAAVESYSLNGFSGEIRLMYGFDASGSVSGYSVLSHAETPGLGAKMDEWFRSDVGNRSVIGRNPGEKTLRVAKDENGDVDGITAATITSRAFLDALERAYKAFMIYRQNNVK